MNAIPAFITNLSFMRDGETVDLNVQHLNDVFLGAMMEQQQVQQQPLFLSLPVFPQSKVVGSLPLPYDGFAEEDELVFRF